MRKGGYDLLDALGVTVSTGIVAGSAEWRARWAAMNALLAPPGLRRQLGTRAREIIEQVADPLAYLQRLTSIIVEARRRGVPRP